MVLGKLPVLERPTIWITVGQGPTALAAGAGGGCLDIFTLIYPFSPLSPSLWETARYRLKYCLKGPLKPKQPTNNQIPDFERRNKISINIIGYGNEAFPLYISKNLDQNTDKHVNLHFVSNAENLDSDGHYCVIQSISRLLCGETRKGNGRLYNCMRCLTAIPRDRLADHERVCSKLQPMNCVTVSEEMKWLEFRNYRWQIQCPFVIVADFQQLYDGNEPSEGRTVREEKDSNHAPLHTCD